MTRLAIAINLDRCVGCHTCALSCKMQNNVPDGMLWNRVLTEGCERFDSAEGTYPNLSRTYLPLACQHCENPACERVCPTGATYKDDKGRVEIDYDKCIGCRMCMAACPYGARIQIKKTGVIEKCRFCWYEGEPGNPPRCVGTCISGARLFGDLDDPQSEICQEIARTNAQPLAGDLTTAKIYYVR